MRILICAYAFAPRIGGAETYVMLLARGLARRLGPTRRTVHDEAANGAVVLATRTPRDGFDDAALPFRVVRRPGPVALWRLLGQADVVQLAGPLFVPLLFGLLRRKPLVVEHHGYQAVCPNGLLLHEPSRTACPGHFMARRYHECLRCRWVSTGWWRNLTALVSTFARQWMSKRVAVNVPVTQHVLERLDLPRSEVVYHGVPDLLTLRVSNRGREHEPGPRGPVAFAYVGRLVQEKGLDLLLRAASRLKAKGYAFSVTFVGEGPERRRLQGLVQEFDLSDSVTFAGWLTGEALEAAMQNVTALVMPSLCEETVGLAAMEQMMRGGVVIASDIGGLGEIVDGAGLKFPAGDVDRLAECMRQVIEDAGLIVDLGSRARARALQLFREEGMVDAHLGIYRGLLRR